MPLEVVADEDGGPEVHDGREDVRRELFASVHAAPAPSRDGSQAPRSTFVYGSVLSRSCGRPSPARHPRAPRRRSRTARTPGCSRASGPSNARSSDRVSAMGACRAEIRAAGLRAAGPISDLRCVTAGIGLSAESRGVSGKLGPLGADFVRRSAARRAPIRSGSGRRDVNCVALEWGAACSLPWSSTGSVPGLADMFTSWPLSRVQALRPARDPTHTRNAAPGIGI